MGKYLKKFSTDSVRVEYEDSENYLEPYVSYVEVDNTVHYNKPETRLIVKYNVEDASNPTPLFVGAESVGFPVSTIYDKIEIDNEEINMSDLSSSEGEEGITVYSYNFESDGQHTVKYTLKDQTMVGIEVDEETDMPSKFGATFAGCPITSVEIPNSVTSIGAMTFYVCTGLTSITIPKSVTSIGASAFRGCSGLTSVTIPDSVTTIGYAAFYECSNLISVTIGSGITSIGGSAFYYCSGLTSVKIPNSVTSIGEFAFRDCRSLTSVTIPDNVTSIGEAAFYECRNLTDIVSLATTAPIIESNTFCGIKTNGTLTVPIGSSGYDVWMGTGNYYLGKYNWTKVEQ